MRAVRASLVVELLSWTFGTGVRGLLKDIIVATKDTIFSNGIDP